ncbi:hypothetical protein TSUD_167910 [Trifolium subterraneum]|nr:hypothetical protein TSUD_167910 [Trifolium subterraneum]
METVPYTKRPHLILISKAVERWFGEIMFEVVRFSYKGELLPSTDPESMRVKIIANSIIDALKKRGLDKENARSEAPSSSALTTKKRNWQLESSHLDGFNWEILVAKGPVKAFCLPGKIVVFTSMLQLCHSDAEIATIMGHETHC